MRLFPRLIAEEVGEEWGDGYDLWRRRWHLTCTGMFWRLQRVGGNLSPTNSAKRMTC